MIRAIVLAAGESRRMGRPKPLLRFEDTTFLGRIVSVLRLSDVGAITVVLGAEAETIQRSVDLSATDVILNEDYRKGQLSSLIAALRNIPPQTEAILLCLVDNPFVNAATVNGIVRAFRETGAAIVVPVCKGKRGHPALFSQALFGELMNAPEQQGARYVLQANRNRITEMQTSDSTVLIGIDTPEDYRLYFGTDP